MSDRVQGESGQSLVVTLSGSPDLSTHTGVFLFRYPESGTVVSRAATLDNTAKTATYRLVAADLAEAGDLLYDVTVTHNTDATDIRTWRGSDGNPLKLSVAKGVRSIRRP